MTRADRIAIILSLLAVLAGFLVSELVFERLAHIEDEMAYLWQAQVLAHNKLSLPSPPEPKSFLVPFVVDHNGQRFGKYPPGWPLILSIGVRFGVPYLVNPLLAGLGVWLTYLLGKRVLSEHVGLLAAGLTLTSPFFMMNSGSLLSHPFGLVLSAGFTLSWLDAFSNKDQPRPWFSTTISAICLGALLLTRPLTALAVAIPFIIHALYLLWKGDSFTRNRLVAFVLIVIGFSGLYFVWQDAVTGDPFLNPYTLWWDYDRIGFGPGHGHAEEGHTLYKARINTRFSLLSGWLDLFGWLNYSWLFLPIGLVAIRKNMRAWLLAAVAPSLVLIYMIYWIGSSLYGPRYYYEGLYSLTLVSAAGISWLAGWSLTSKQKFPNFQGWRRIRALAVTALVTFLIAFNLVFYLPARLESMQGLYGISRSHQQPFLTASAQALTPALIVVHTSDSWVEYGTLIELQSPFFDTPFIFIISRGASIDQVAASAFPDRRVFHYFPDEPYKFYSAPRLP